MAKSSRASTRKANNQRLKENVFGPVEDARQQRLAAKLLEIASQPKPVLEEQMKDVPEEEEAEPGTANVHKAGSKETSRHRHSGPWHGRHDTAELLTFCACSRNGHRSNSQVHQIEKGQGHQETEQEIQHCISKVRRPQDDQEEEVI